MKGNYPLSWLHRWLVKYGSGFQYELLPVVQPVVELSREWPIPVETRRINLAAINAGTSLLVLDFTGFTYAPPTLIDPTRVTGHFLVLNLWLNFTNGNLGGGDALELQYRHGEGELAELNRIQGGGPAVILTDYALIGGRSQLGDSNGNFFGCVGHAPVYVAPGAVLIVELTGMVGTEQAFVRARGIWVPDPSQPINYPL